MPSEPLLLEISFPAFVQKGNSGNVVQKTGEMHSKGCTPEAVFSKRERERSTEISIGLIF